MMELQFIQHTDIIPIFAVKVEYDICICYGPLRPTGCSVRRNTAYFATFDANSVLLT